MDVFVIFTNAPNFYACDTSSSEVAPDLKEEHSTVANQAVDSHQVGYLRLLSRIPSCLTGSFRPFGMLGNHERVYHLCVYNMPC